MNLVTTISSHPLETVQVHPMLHAAALLGGRREWYGRSVLFPAGSPEWRCGVGLERDSGRILLSLAFEGAGMVA